jgi:hypothetical protein
MWLPIGFGNARVSFERSQTKRNKVNPMGDPSCRMVAEGNQDIQIVIGIALLSTLVNANFVIEQPLSSIMGDVPTLKRLTAVLPVLHGCVWMGAWGATTAKPLRLWSTAPWITDLVQARRYRKMEASLVKRTLNRAGIRAAISADLKSCPSTTPQCKNPSQFTPSHPTTPAAPPTTASPKPYPTLMLTLPPPPPPANPLNPSPKSILSCLCGLSRRASFLHSILIVA